MADATAIERCRADFPALSGLMNGKPLAYLDTASSAQKPRAVLDSLAQTLGEGYANIHRGLYAHSQDMTRAYEAVRAKVAGFINAASEREIVFTRNSTEAINLFAASWGGAALREGDEIILSAMEHHANIVPWQMVAARTGAVIRVIPLREDGTLDLDSYARLLSPRTRIVSVVHISNALGTINPVVDLVKMAKANNNDTLVFVDGSQSVVHGPVDVRTLGCDALCFTGHKLYGPTGAGVLWARSDLLDTLPPYQGGGDMIERVSFAGTTYKTAPHRFEAGTPAIAEIIALGAAVDYLAALGMENIAAHEQALSVMLGQALNSVGGLKLYGPKTGRAGIFSFTADWAHPSDIAMVLDQCGVAVRTGHHCCMPLMDALGIDGSVRASLGLYTNADDINALTQGLLKAKDMLS